MKKILLIVILFSVACSGKFHRKAPEYRWQWAMFYKQPVGATFYVDTLFAIATDTLGIRKIDSTSDEISAKREWFRDTFWFWVKYDTLKGKKGINGKDSIQRTFTQIPKAWVSPCTLDRR